MTSPLPGEGKPCLHGTNHHNSLTSHCPHSHPGYSVCRVREPPLDRHVAQTPPHYKPYHNNFPSKSSLLSPTPPPPFFSQLPIPSPSFSFLHHWCFTTNTLHTPHLYYPLPQLPPTILLLTTLLYPTPLSPFSLPLFPQRHLLFPLTTTAAYPILGDGLTPPPHDLTSPISPSSD